MSPLGAIEKIQCFLVGGCGRGVDVLVCCVGLGVWDAGCAAEETDAGTVPQAQLGLVSREAGAVGSTLKSVRRRCWRS